MNQPQTTRKTLTIEELFSDLFHSLLEKNQVDEVSFHRLIDLWVEANSPKVQHAMEKANWKRRFTAKGFSHRVFIVGIQVLGVESFDLALDLHYSNKNPSKLARGTCVDTHAAYNLADI